MHTGQLWHLSLTSHSSWDSKCTWFWHRICKKFQAVFIVRCFSTNFKASPSFIPPIFATKGGGSLKIYMVTGTKKLSLTLENHLFTVYGRVIFLDFSFLVPIFLLPRNFRGWRSLFWNFPIIKNLHKSNLDRFLLPCSSVLLGSGWHD